MKETFDDATQLAIRDQERAGIDIVCDGEMRRFFFVQTFYAKMDGLEPVEPLRRRDSTPTIRRRATGRGSASRCRAGSAWSKSSSI